MDKGVLEKETREIAGDNKAKAEAGAGSGSALTAGEAKGKAEAESGDESGEAKAGSIEAKAQGNGNASATAVLLTTVAVAVAALGVLAIEAQKRKETRTALKTPIDWCALFRRYVPRTGASSEELSAHSRIVPFPDAVQQLRCLRCGWWNTTDGIGRIDQIMKDDNGRRLVPCDICGDALPLPHRMFRHTRQSYLRIGDTTRIAAFRLGVVKAAQGESHYGGGAWPCLARIVVDYLTWCVPQIHDIIDCSDHLGTMMLAVVRNRRERQFDDDVNTDTTKAPDTDKALTLTKTPNTEAKSLKVHFLGWGDQWNEWLPADHVGIDTGVHSLTGFLRISELTRTLMNPTSPSALGAEVLHRFRTRSSLEFTLADVDMDAEYSAATLHAGVERPLQYHLEGQRFRWGPFYLQFPMETSRWYESKMLALISIAVTPELAAEFPEWPQESTADGFMISVDEFNALSDVAETRGCKSIAVYLDGRKSKGIYYREREFAEAVFRATKCRANWEAIFTAMVMKRVLEYRKRQRQ